MIWFGLSVLAKVSGVGGQLSPEEGMGANVLFALSFVPPVVGMAAGWVREARRMADLDRLEASRNLPLRDADRNALAAEIATIWRALGQRDRPAPALAVIPKFDVRAHAFDENGTQTIGLTSALAARLRRHDKLAQAILRHEMAHLLHRDMPALRRQGAAGSAAVLSADVAMASCAIVAGVIIAFLDGGHNGGLTGFAALLDAHVAIVLAALLITVPLLLGRYILRRYAGLLVALIETRADVSAGLWGEGLVAFADLIGTDAGVRRSSLWDIGAAYVSPFLTHLPERERRDLVSRPDRLATPKLGYFALAAVMIWLLTFHQGTEVWDAALLNVVVAFIIGLTVLMVRRTQQRVVLPATRLTTLAAGLTALQALPLISVEGLAYLSEHLTAAVVTPGGFGGATNRDYLDDCRITLEEFAGHVQAATGGVWWPAAIVLGAACLWVLGRPIAKHRPRRGPWEDWLTASVAGLTSIVVSCGFFQAALYWPVRMAAFHTSEQPNGIWGHVPEAMRRVIDIWLLELSDVLHGPPILGDLAPLRLALPLVVTAAVAVPLGVAARANSTGASG